MASRVWFHSPGGRLAASLLATAALAALTGCHPDMWQQNKIQKPLQQSDFFADGQSARPPVAGTVARGHVRADKAFYTGIASGSRINTEITAGTPVQTGIFRGRYVDTFPMPITRRVLERGRERYNIYCSPCHGMVGDGNGMIAQRWLVLRKPPANYHTDRLRRAPVGHFFDVITNGFGTMFSYASRVDPVDRWAIIAYIRVLQRSQNARAADVPPEERARLAPQTVAPAPPGSGATQR